MKVTWLSIKVYINVWWYYLSTTLLLSFVVLIKVIKCKVLP